MMNERDEEFDWSPLGEAWWRQAAADLSMKVTDRQIKLACAKHRGCSNTEAARQAGYADGEDVIRQSAYKASTSRGVVQLLAFATSEASGPTNPDLVDTTEARQILSKLARSGDPNTQIRAVEQLTKLKEREAAFGQSVDSDGLSQDRVARDMLRMAGGAAAIVVAWTGSGQRLESLPLLLDVYEAISKEEPDLWALKVSKGSPADRASLQRRLSNPDWQRETRVKLWREIGIDIVAAKTATAATPNEIQQSTAFPSDGDIVGHDGGGESAWEEEQQEMRA